MINKDNKMPENKYKQPSRFEFRLFDDGTVYLGAVFARENIAYMLKAIEIADQIMALDNNPVEEPATTVPAGEKYPTDGMSSEAFIRKERDEWR